MLAHEVLTDMTRQGKAEEAGRTRKERGLRGIIKEYADRKPFSEPIFEGYKKVGDKFAIWDKGGDKKLNELQIENLEAEYKADRNTAEFKALATANGYKSKQNLSKTIMEGLRKRIFELKEGSGIDQRIETVSLSDRQYEFKNIPLSCSV